MFYTSLIFANFSAVLTAILATITPQSLARAHMYISYIRAHILAFHNMYIYETNGRRIIEKLTTNRIHDDNNPMYLKFIHHTMWESINASLIISNILLLSLNLTVKLLRIHRIQCNYCLRVKSFKRKQSLIKQAYMDRINTM